MSRHRSGQLSITFMTMKILSSTDQIGYIVGGVVGGFGVVLLIVIIIIISVKGANRLMYKVRCT